MGEHCGHQHHATQELKHFLLDYDALKNTKIENWMKNFEYPGIILTKNSTKALRELTRVTETKMLSFDVIGIMTPKQMAILKRFQTTLCIEFYTDWMIVNCITNDQFGMWHTLPVALLYCNRMLGNVLQEFFKKINEIVGHQLSTEYVITNERRRCSEAWQNVNSKGDHPKTKFIQNLSEIFLTLKENLHDHTHASIFERHCKRLQRLIFNNIEDPKKFKREFDCLIKPKLRNHVKDIDHKDLLQVCSEWYYFCSIETELHNFMYHNEIARYVTFDFFCSEPIPVSLNLMLLCSRSMLKVVPDSDTLNTAPYLMVSHPDEEMVEE